MATKLFQQHINKDLLRLGCKSLLIVLVVWIGVSILLTLVSLSAFLQHQYDLANGLAQIAKPGSRAVAGITSGLAPQAKLWPLTLEGIIAIPSLETSLDQVARDYTMNGQISLVPLSDSLSQLQAQLTHVITSLPPASTQNYLRKTDHVARQAIGLISLLQTLSTGQKRALILIQGPDELRPTGGFLGAYGIAEFRDGLLQSIQFEDIYDASGQFASHLQPPPGVAEYTSGGQGWNLPDANWSPDYPTAAKTVAMMMQSAGKGEFDVIITLNTDVLSQLLTLTGPIDLPEYQTQLSPENVDQLLADHRKSYFPGSRAKATLLSQAFPHILQSLFSLPPTERFELMKLFLRNLDQKDIQWWSRDPDLGRVLLTAGANSLLHPPKFLPTIDQNWYSTQSAAWLGLVEANVGINKVNPAIQRSYVITRNGDELTVEVTWHNGANQAAVTLNTLESSTYRPNPFISPAPEASHSAYVNYVRLVTSDDIELLSSSGSATPQAPTELLPLDSSSLSSEDATQVTSRFVQTPYLLVVKPEETVTHVFQLRIPAHTPVILWKQSGIEPTPILYQHENSTTHFSLESDTLLVGSE